MIYNSEDFLHVLCLSGSFTSNARFPEIVFLKDYWMTWSLSITLKNKLYPGVIQISVLAYFLTLSPVSPLRYQAKLSCGFPQIFILTKYFIVAENLLNYWTKKRATGATLHCSVCILCPHLPLQPFLCFPLLPESACICTTYTLSNICVVFILLCLYMYMCIYIHSYCIMYHLKLLLNEDFFKAYFFWSIPLSVFTLT